MFRPFLKSVVLVMLLILLGACLPVAPSPSTPSAASTMEILPVLPSPTFTPQVASPTAGPLPLKFAYLPPAPRLSLPSVVFRDTGAVVFQDGQFHLFYNGLYDWPPSEVNIAYAVSPDGLTWQQVENETVISEADIPYPVFSILASSVLVMPDGTWVLYFYTWGNGLEFIPPSLIGRATAASPAGPWKVDPEPVLLPSEEGWDLGSVQRPDVIRVGDNYYMSYVGTGPAGSQVGLATSSDGIHWTKYDDPATTEPLVAQSDPVFTPLQAGSEDLELRYPRLRRTPDGWLLFYWVNTPGWPQANPFDPTNGRIGLATSPDGLHWTRLQEEPILTPEEIGQGISAIYTPNMVFLDDVYYMFIEMEVTTGTSIFTRIILTVHEGLLFP